MRRFRLPAHLVILASVVALVACARDPITKPSARREMIERARSERLWTGVAVSEDGRVFVNYPRWAPSDLASVVELMNGSRSRPYPDERWNQWNPELPPEDRFVCVQSVHIDRDGDLWILDPGLDTTRGIIEGGPKLIKVDLDTDSAVQEIRFDRSIAPPNSYLNDVRVNTGEGYAYVTESGLGAIIVVNIATGESRRLLSEHPSTKSENVTLTIGGKEWLRPDGSVPQIHADGLALDAGAEYLYYQALTGRTLYRIATRYLHDTSLTEDELGGKVEFVAETGASDAIEFGPDGYLYLTSIEHDAIRRLEVGGEIETVAQNPLLAWPDSLAITSDGTIFVTTSQIHLGPKRTEPYRIFELQPAD